MRRLLRVIESLARRAAGLEQGEPEPSGDQGKGQLREPDPMPAVKDALRARREIDRHRFGAPASVDDTGWVKQRLVYMDGPTQVIEDETVVRECDACGVLLSFGNKVKGRCRLCGGRRVVCTECHAFCERCGALCCRMHTVRHGEHTFCVRHRWWMYWLRFWGLLE